VSGYIGGMVDAIEDEVERCPNCGRERDLWTENEGLGVIAGGVLYCSSDCALEDQEKALKDP
jgi:hypothetical protein